MKLAYYPGCSLEGSARDYDHSVRQVCRAIGIELVEIPDWNCCGASSAHMTDHEIGMRLPMRNLLLAMEMGLDILVPCAACFQRLKAADKALRADPGYWDLKAYAPDYTIIHISTLLARADILERIEGALLKPLTELSLACYYGCLSLRNPRVTGAPDWETPENLERIVRAVGAAPVSWSHRTECCSGSLTLARPDIAVRLVGDIVRAARRAGATAIVTDCPMCQANVESRQLDAGGREAPLPVFFAAELLAAAFSGEYPASQQKTHLIAPDILSSCFSQPGSAREGTR
jgi:heterodisulfide reductase subunit B